MKRKVYWRVGYAPYSTIPGPIFEDRAQCAARAKQENRYGQWRGRGCKPYRCTEDGELLIEQPKGRRR